MSKISNLHNEKLPDKLLLVMAGTSCNTHCMFCRAFSMLKNRDRSTQEIVLELQRHKNKYSNVEFTGGEFTIRKDAVPLVKLASQLGYTSISLETNGKMLAYRDFSEKIIKAGVNHISFSIHGPALQRMTR